MQYCILDVDKVEPAHFFFFFGLSSYKRHTLAHKESPYKTVDEYILDIKDSFRLLLWMSGLFLLCVVHHRIIYHS